MIDERLPLKPQASKANKQENHPFFGGSMASSLNIRRQLQSQAHSLTPFESGAHPAPSMFAGCQRPYMQPPTAPHNSKTSKDAKEAEKMIILKDFLRSCDELKYLPHPNYFKYHPHIDTKTRRTVVDWVIGLTRIITVKTDVSFDAVNMFDRLFSSTESSSTLREAHLVGLVSFYLACQNEQLTKLERSHLLKLSHDQFTDAEIDETIALFQRTVNYGLKFTSPLQFFDAFACFLDFSDQEKHFGWMLLEVALMDYKMIDCLPTLQACSAAFITCYFHGKKLSLKPILALLGYESEAQLDVFHQVKDRMLEFYHRLRQHKNQSQVFEKFASSNYYAVSKIEFLAKPVKLDLIR